MNQETIERIELKIAFLEGANTELSDVVYRQQREIEALKIQLAALEGRVESATSDPGLSLDEERPPHY